MAHVLVWQVLQTRVAAGDCALIGIMQTIFIESSSSWLLSWRCNATTVYMKYEVSEFECNVKCIASFFTPLFESKVECNAS